MEESVANLQLTLSLIRTLHRRGLVDAEDVLIDFGNVIDMQTKLGLNGDSLPHLTIVYGALGKVVESLKLSEVDSQPKPGVGSGE